ncbi:HAD family phosphatase [Chromobacterium sp. IIBBL 290-4]|uniref:HAD family hydrolase n=1 Tax=Chromobacterium sp. IIBBL 290-4 TaxID=2953890 RepID=UPI0020B8689B|nr:HAD-IA family hydrolase [Chromobacterium sp. IIBBL 290-4]UTH74695.1 HAD-IA family hydrolase [Chromobacterium sp. IIBBL 290-4]
MNPSQFTLLFDLDGTLTRTDHLHYQAFASLMADNGRELTPEIYKRDVLGGSNESIMKALFPDMPERHAEFAELKEQRFRASVTQLTPTHGLGKLFDWAREQRIPVAVVTNAPRANADLMLSALELMGKIDTLVIGDELPQGKPHPLPYLTALRQLGGRADRACAFEDSPSGIRAARAAGLHTFGLIGELSAADLLQAGASAAIEHFDAPELWRWLAEAQASGSACPA